MLKPFEVPQILTDKTRLQEIYELRVLAWENSSSKKYINKMIYPNGLYDHLDENAVHWISYNNEDKIIAAARVVIINNITELPYPKIFADALLPQIRPFLFYSRMVIHPDYRKLGLKDKLDDIRLNFMLNNKIAFSVATASPKRTEDLIKYGWKTLLSVSNDKDSSFPFGRKNLLLLLLEDVRLKTTNNESFINT